MRQGPPLTALELVPAQKKEFASSRRMTFDDLSLTLTRLAETIPTHGKNRDTYITKKN